MKWLKRLFCFHGKGKVWKLLDIEYDGTSVVECTKCGAIKRRGLQ
jgi:hypothetical protein